jgi:pimeloyl-ACP methyl ester carboxylesterase
MVFTEIIVFTDKFDRTILRLRRAFSCRPFALVCAGKRSAMIVGVIVELLLVPLVLVPFVLEPFLPRHVQKLRDSEHGRFIFLLHGSGANSANYCFGRFFLALNGHKTNVVFFNYLGGPIKTSPRGNITTLSAEVARQFETTLYDKILEKDADDRQGTTRSSTGGLMRLTVLGHSLGALVLTDLLACTLAAHGPAAATIRAHAHAIGRDHAQLVRWERAILLSGPFGGSDLLGWLHRHIPIRILSIMGLAGDPALTCQHEFLPGCESGRRLTDALRACIDRSQTDEAAVAVSLATGALDFCVRPHSALPFGADASGCALQGPRKSPSSSRLFEDVGHYTIAASSSVWDWVLQQL